MKLNNNYNIYVLGKKAEHQLCFINDTHTQLINFFPPLTHNNFRMGPLYSKKKHITMSIF